MTRAARLDTALVALTLLACLLGWLGFWNFGQLALNAQDWPKEAYYLDVLRQSLLDFGLPFYVPVDLQGTTRFLAIPEWPLSPQILLLPLLANGTFFMVNCLLLWLVGVYGCFRLRREHALDTVSFVAFLLLFTFNGHIVAHLAVGHSMWVGYFLSPFVLLHILRFAGGDGSTGNALALAIWLAAMMFQGAFHLTIYFAMLLAAVGLTTGSLQLRGRLIFVAAVAVATGLLGAVRVLPAFAAFQEADQAFISGYPGPGVLLDGLAALGQPGYPQLGGFSGFGLGWWEYDAYVGPAGLVALLVFATRHLASGEDHAMRAVAGAGLVLVVLSFGEVVYLLGLAGVPVIGQERVPSRILVAPLLCLMLAAARGYTGFAAGRPRSMAPFAAVGVALIAGGLATHALVWRVAALEETPESVWQIAPAVPAPDAGYERLWVIALCLSGAAWTGAFAYLAVHRRRRYRGAERGPRTGVPLA